MSRPRKTKIPPLFGLVLVGGQSARMGQPKWSLRYHGKTQLEHCATLLRTHCEKVFISCRADQTLTFESERVPEIHDFFPDAGPMGGVLSAMKMYPQAAWLSLACDLPYITDETLAALVDDRDSAKLATAFTHKDGMPEPLCAIYEPQFEPHLSLMQQKDSLSLRRALEHPQVEILTPSNSLSLRSVNDPDEHVRAVDFFRKQTLSSR